MSRDRALEGLQAHARSFLAVPRSRVRAEVRSTR